LLVKFQKKTGFTQWGVPEEDLPGSENGQGFFGFWSYLGLGSAVVGRRRGTRLLSRTERAEHRCGIKIPCFLLYRGFYVAPEKVLMPQCL